MGKTQKKHHRPQFNNNNPNNKLQLNKFHQITDKKHISQSKMLRKKKRDLERLLHHRRQKNEEVDQEKQKQLQQMNEQLGDKSKKYEKNMRKQFFLQNKYKQIKEIEMRKIKKRLNHLQQQQHTEQVKSEIAQLQKKQRYIKFYPKDLKYVSLFPNSKPLEQAAVEFQQKIMNDIEQKHKKLLKKKNTYISQNKNTEKKQKKETIKRSKDNFFIMQQQRQDQQVQ